VFGSSRARTRGGRENANGASSSLTDSHLSPRTADAEHGNVASPGRMLVERLLAHDYAHRFGFFVFAMFGIGGGTLMWVGRGCLRLLLGKCLSVRQIGSVQGVFGGVMKGIGRASWSGSGGLRDTETDEHARTGQTHEKG
jgi:hypothetical protein